MLAPVLKRLLFLSIAGLGVAAVAGHLLERAGVLRCDCEATCWCKQPGYSLFRWVTPRSWHHLADPPGDSVNDVEPEPSISDLLEMADAVREAQSAAPSQPTA
jgi:hypothetical protein